MTNKSHNILEIIWVILGLFVMVYSYKLGITIDVQGTPNPGPGVMPFFAGLLLASINICTLIVSIFRKEGTFEVNKQGRRRMNYGKILVVTSALLIYAFFFEEIGYLISTFLLFNILLLTGTGGRKFILILIISILTVAVTYFGFTYLGIIFPRGVLAL